MESTLLHTMNHIDLRFAFAILSRCEKMLTIVGDLDRVSYRLIVWIASVRPRPPSSELSLACQDLRK